MVANINGRKRPSTVGGIALVETNSDTRWCLKVSGDSVGAVSSPESVIDLASVLARNPNVFLQTVSGKSGTTTYLPAREITSITVEQVAVHNGHGLANKNMQTCEGCSNHDEDDPEGLRCLLVSRLVPDGWAAAKHD
jgi:hypothetical protein